MQKFLHLLSLSHETYHIPLLLQTSPHHSFPPSVCHRFIASLLLPWLLSSNSSYKNLTNLLILIRSIFCYFFFPSADSSFFSLSSPRQFGQKQTFNVKTMIRTCWQHRLQGEFQQITCWLQRQLSSRHIFGSLYKHMKYLRNFRAHIKYFGDKVNFCTS